MSRKGQLVTAAMAVLFVVLAFHFFTKSPEPHYRGKPLRLWLDQLDYQSNFVDGQGRRLPAWEEAAEAVRAIGTNAIPFVMQRLNRPQWRLTDWLLERGRRWYGPIPVSNRRVINFFKTDRDHKRDAVEVILVLRDQAAPAVPQLIAMLGSSHERDAQLAAVALAQIGSPAEAALPALMAKVQQRKYYAFEAIGRFGTASRQAVPVLIPFLSDHDASYRVRASFALSLMGSNAVEAAPALLASLSDTNESVRLNSLSAVTSIGVRDEAMLKALSVLTNDPSAVIRDKALGILKTF